MNLNLLTAHFVGFLRAHAMRRHFRRFASLDLLRRAPVSKELPPPLAQTLRQAAQASEADLLAALGTRAAGLTEEEAQAIQARVGPNEVEHEKPLPWWLHLWLSYKNPFNLLLTVLALVSYYTEDMKATAVIGTMVVLSTFMRFIQEARSNSAADKLKAMVSNTATVTRRMPDSKGPANGAQPANGGRRLELPIKDLVPGDIVQLSAGDMIPADCRVLSAKDLFVSQAAMTGEALPVEKFAAQRGAASANPLELDNLCFMGTNVVSGAASAVVVMTGNHTYFGALAERVTATDRTPNAFQSGVNQISWLLIRFMLVMAPIVLLINGFTKGDWLEAFLFALSVAVGLTPEMLPMIVTSTLAKGAVFLSRKKVIVKRLDAIQNFGAMDVLCADKTGTLTQDRIFLERHTDIFGHPDDEVLEYAYLNSFYQTGLKNLLDVAVLNYGDPERERRIATAYRKVDEIPFDFVRRRMSVVVSEREDHHELICKGAVEEILAACAYARKDGVAVPLTPELLAQVLQTTGSLNAEGLRVIAVAARDLPPTREVYGVADERELVLIGYIAFLDPPKETTAAALAALKEHGVAVKILTGDNELVTAKICREVGLPVEGMVLGAAVEQMDRRPAGGRGRDHHGIRQAEPGAQGTHRAPAA